MTMMQQVHSCTRCSTRRIDRGQYQQFSDADGFDVTAWHDFGLLRDIRELRMTCYAAQQAAAQERLKHAARCRTALSCRFPVRQRGSGLLSWLSATVTTPLPARRPAHPPSRAGRLASGWVRSTGIRPDRVPEPGQGAARPSGDHKDCVAISFILGI
jgi:hypothetical protein